MKRLMRLGAATTLLYPGLTGATALEADDAPVACLYPSQIERTSYGSDTVAYVKTTRGRIHRLETATPCFDPRGRVESLGSVRASARLCAGERVRVTVTLGRDPRVCVAALSAAVTDRTELRAAGLGPVD